MVWGWAMRAVGPGRPSPPRLSPLPQQQIKGLARLLGWPDAQRGHGLDGEGPFWLWRATVSYVPVPCVSPAVALR